MNHVESVVIPEFLGCIMLRVCGRTVSYFWCFDVLCRNISFTGAVPGIHKFCLRAPHKQSDYQTKKSRKKELEERSPAPPGRHTLATR